METEGLRLWFSSLKAPESEHVGVNCNALLYVALLDQLINYLLSNLFILIQRFLTKRKLRNVVTPKLITLVKGSIILSPKPDL